MFPAGSQPDSYRDRPGHEANHPVAGPGVAGSVRVPGVPVPGGAQPPLLS